MSLVATVTSSTVILPAGACVAIIDVVVVVCVVVVGIGVVGLDVTFVPTDGITVTTGVASGILVPLNGGGVTLITVELSSGNVFMLLIKGNVVLVVSGKIGESNSSVVVLVLGTVVVGMVDLVVWVVLMVSLVVVVLVVVVDVLVVVAAAVVVVVVVLVVVVVVVVVLLVVLVAPGNNLLVGAVSGSAVATTVTAGTAVVASMVVVTTKSVGVLLNKLVNESINSEKSSVRLVVVVDVGGTAVVCRTVSVVGTVVGTAVSVDCITSTLTISAVWVGSTADEVAPFVLASKTALKVDGSSSVITAVMLTGGRFVGYCSLPKMSLKIESTLSSVSAVVIKLTSATVVS